MTTGPYAIMWGKDWTFQTVPAHQLPKGHSSTLYPDKSMALSAAISKLEDEHQTLKQVIKAARKRRRHMDYNASLREQR